MDKEATPPDPVVSVPSRIIALDGSSQRDEGRAIAVEIPVEISFSDVRFAVMMLTPADLVDFAYGFSLTEGVVERGDAIRKITVSPAEGGLALRIDLAGEDLHKHLSRQRAMTGRTGCGVCGIDDIGALQRAERGARTPQFVSVTSLAKALGALDERQTLNVATHAVHAAAWAGQDGTLIEVREDVGRHNALDKLIGALLRAHVDPSSGFILITSRCSFEMVEKAATFGAQTLVAISAPTSLAIARAEALDVTLIAIARRDTLTAFTNLERMMP